MGNNTSKDVFSACSLHSPMWAVEITALEFYSFTVYLNFFSFEHFAYLLYHGIHLSALKLILYTCANTSVWNPFKSPLLFVPKPLLLQI